jgi:hypothetical protein
MVLGLCENVFNTSATSSGIPPRGFQWWIVCLRWWIVCLQVVDRLPPAVDRLPPVVDRFGQRFMVACALAFDLDRENARHFLPRTPMYKSTLWPRLLFRGEGNFIVQDFVAFLTAKVHHSLALGSLYLR